MFSTSCKDNNSQQKQEIASTNQTNRTFETSNGTSEYEQNNLYLQKEP